MTERGRSLYRPNSSTSITTLRKRDFSSGNPTLLHQKEYRHSINVASRAQSCSSGKGTPNYQSLLTAARPTQQKNIPMEDSKPLVDSRGSRWTNFTLTQLPKEEAKTDETHFQIATKPKKSSVSPLTSSYRPHTENNGLDTTDVTPSENRFDDLESLGSSNDVQSKKAPSLTDKLQKIGSNMLANGLDRTSRFSSMLRDSAPVSRYASESDSSSEDEDDDEETRLNELDNFSAANDITDIARELEDIRSKATASYNPDPFDSHTSRVQQRALQFRDLKDQEETSFLGNTMGDVSVRLQNEELLSEWNSIRLRFSNYVSSDLQKPQTLAGVLGSIGRVRCDSNHPRPVQRPFKDEFLANVWQDEYRELFDPPKFQTTIDDDTDIYALHAVADLSSMARNVNLLGPINEN